MKHLFTDDSLKMKRGLCVNDRMKIIGFFKTQTRQILRKRISFFNLIIYVKYITKTIQFTYSS